MTEKCYITGCDKPGEKVITSTKHLKRYYCYTHYKEVSIIIRSMYRSTYSSRRRRLAKLKTNKRGGLISFIIFFIMLSFIIILQLVIIYLDGGSMAFGTNCTNTSLDGCL